MVVCDSLSFAALPGDVGKLPENDSIANLVPSTVP